MNEEDSRPLRVAGFCCDHIHLEQLLTTASSSGFEVVGVYDPDRTRLAEASRRVGVPASSQFTQPEELVEVGAPDIALVCSTTAAHLGWCKRLAAARVHIVLEKPFALDAAECEAATRAARESQVILAINWPLAWYPSHRAAHDLVKSGTIGEVIEIHYMGGNRGPKHHVRDDERFEGSWWTRPEDGGGAMRDYLGYGTTLATWFRGGELPIAVTAARHFESGSAVECHGIAVAEYPSGLSMFQSRWGTFSDPWVNQPQPACGFTIVGTEGTILSLDYADAVWVQTPSRPEGEGVTVSETLAGPQNIFQEVRRALETGDDISAPFDPITSRAGQLIVDAALESAATGRRVEIATAG